MTITEFHARFTFASNCYVVQSREGSAFIVDPGAEIGRASCRERV